MPYRCTAFGCKSGYDSHPNDGRVTFHGYPRDPDLCDRWIRANPRKDFKPSKYSKMCSLHFRDFDFVEEHCDSNPRRRRKYSTSILVRRYLKKDAVPSIFPLDGVFGNFEQLISPTKSRAAAATTSSGRRHQKAQLKTLPEKFEAEDNVQSLTPNQIKDKLSAETAIPGGFQLLIMDGMLVIYWLRLIDTVPYILASITVKPKLTVHLMYDKNEIPAALYRDLLPATLQTMSQLLNLMALVKGWCED